VKSIFLRVAENWAIYGNNPIKGDFQLEKAGGNINNRNMEANPKVETPILNTSTIAPTETKGKKNNVTSSENESNSSIYSVGSLPDLAMNYFYIENTSSCISGQKPRFKFSYSNLGSIGTSIFTHQIYIDDVPWYSFTGSINTGETKYYYWDLAVYGEGLKKIDLKLDSTNQITESNESNNMMSISQNWIGTGGPNLKFKRFEVRNGTPFEAGKQTYWDYSMYNNGSQTAAGTSTAQFYYDNTEGYYLTFVDLKPGWGFYNNEVWYQPDKEGNHTIKFEIDPSNIIAETNEYDNLVERTYYWSGIGPDLVVQQFEPTKDPPYLTASYVPFNYSETNWGTADAPVHTSKIKINNVDKMSYTTALPVSYSFSGTWNSYVTSPGVKTISYLVDSSNQVTEQNNSNNNSVLSYEWEDKELPIGSIRINNGALATSILDVALNLSASYQGNSNGLEMRFKEDNGSWTSWESYKALKSWRLNSGGGVKTIYVEYRNSAGETSSIYSDLIIYQSTKVIAKGYVKPILKNYHYTNAVGTATAFEGFEVEIMDMESGSGVPLGVGYTDANGYFEIEVPNNSNSPENGYDLFVRLELDDEYMTIYDYTSTCYSWDSTIRYDVQTDTVDFGTLSPTPEGAFNIWYWLKKGNDYYRHNAFNSGILPKAAVYWQIGNTMGSQANSTTIYINEEDHFDSSVILHELGHYVIRNVSKRPDGAGGKHSFSTKPQSTRPEGATYSEGWASFFMLAAKNGEKYIDSDATTYFGADFENVKYYKSTDIGVPYTLSAKGFDYELNVGAVLLDLLDSNNEHSNDNITMIFTNLDRIMRQKLDDMHEFYSTLFSLGKAINIERDVWNTFNHRGMAYDIQVPAVNITKVSQINTQIIFDGLATDDVDIQHTRWYIDGAVQASSINEGPPKRLTIDTTVLTDGNHTVTLRAYDPEGYFHGTNLRTMPYGDTSQTFTVNNAQTMTPVDDLMNNDSYNPGPSNKNDEKVKLQKGEKKFFEVTGELIGNKDRKQIIKVDGKTNLKIYLHLLGAVKKINLYDNKNNMIFSEAYLMPDQPIEVRSAEKGNWILEIIPLENSKDYYKVPYKAFATESVSKLDIEFPNSININELEVDFKTVNKQDVVVMLNGKDIAVDSTNNIKRLLCLNEGINEISIYSYYDNEIIEHRNWNIYVDTTAPKLNLENLIAKTNKKGIRYVQLRGQVNEECTIITDGNEQLNMNERDKPFAIPVILKDNQKTLSIEVIDKVGNRIIEEMLINEEQ